MACTEFQDRLLAHTELSDDERASVDTHVAGCPECREFLETLHLVDSALTAKFARCEVSGAFSTTVRQRIRRAAPIPRPSLIPELLDFVGWGAIVALAALLAWWVTPLIPVSETLPFPVIAAGAGALLLSISVIIGLRSFADLKR